MSTRSCGIALWMTVLAWLALPVAVHAQTDGDHTYSSAAIQSGLRLYVSECAICHGPNGDEVDGINLRTGSFRRVQSDEDIREVVTTGVGGRRMPAFDFRDDELDGIVAYIRAGFDPSGVAVRVGDPARGEALFNGAGDCASCHRVNGVGPRAAPDLSEIGSLRTPSALSRTLLEPEAALLPINRPVRLVTSTGEEVRGRRLNENTYTVQIIDSNGRLRSFHKAELTTFEVSTVPTMQPTTLSADEVADLLGYLLSLTGDR